MTSLDPSKLMRGQHVVVELPVTVLEQWPSAVLVSLPGGTHLRIPKDGTAWHGDFHTPPPPVPAG